MNRDYSPRENTERTEKKFFRQRDKTEIDFYIECE